MSALQRAELFLKIDFVKIGLEADADTVRILSGAYDISFQREEIEETELLAELPEDYYHRTNGADTEDMLLGKFQANHQGNCRLYIYKGYSPILKMVLPEYTVFVNSKTEGEVQNWYRLLKS